MIRSSRRPDYYGILGVSRDAPPDAIDDAFRTLIQKYRDTADQHDRAREVRLAHKVLSDPERRARYDQSAEPNAHTVEPPSSDQHTPAAPPGRARWIAAAALVPIVVGGFYGLPLSTRDRAQPPPPVSKGQTVGRPRPLAATFAPTPEASKAAVLAAAPVATLPTVAQAAPPASPAAAMAPTRSAGATSQQGPLAAGAARDQDQFTQAAEAVQPAVVSTPAAAVAFEAQPPAPPRPAAQPTAARWVSGGLANADNRHGKFEGTVSVRITVLPDGSAANCRIARSSGNAALDRTTCQLLERRLRFEPARDAAGQPYATDFTATHSWVRVRRSRW